MADDRWKDAETVEQFRQERRRPRPFEAAVKDVMQRLLRGVYPPIERLLDVGCGTGLIADWSLEVVPRAQAILADFSGPMLDGARADWADRPEDVTFVETDFTTPSWSGSVRNFGPFDAVVTGFAVHHAPHDRKPAIHAEMVDLLRPGGILINCEHVALPTEWLMQVGEQWLAETLLAADGQALDEQRVREKMDQIAQRPDVQEGMLVPADMQAQWLREIGCIDVDTPYRCFGMAVITGRRPF